jgi:signal transduction histidine kinase
MVLILVAAAAWWLAGRALKPIETLTNTIKSISTKELNERVAITSSDKEFSQLITVFNELLGRLERSFQQATRFSGDAAHELKTPLAIIQGQLESSIQAADAGSVIQEKLSHTLDEVRRLSSISQKLLLLSQADAGKLRLHREPFALSQTLTDITEDAQMLAPSINITCDITSNITINADAVLLRQALQNIITNAIKYNIENGWITITAQKTVGDIIIEIKNSSTRLSQEVSKNLFERFYRGDASHNRQVEGFGLGLSLAQEIIKAHDGSLTLNKNTEHETGFLIMLSDRSK